MFYKTINFKNTVSYLTSKIFMKKINELKINIRSKYLKSDKDFS